MILTVIMALVGITLFSSNKRIDKDASKIRLILVNLVFLALKLHLKFKV